MENFYIMGWMFPTSMTEENARLRSLRKTDHNREHIHYHKIMESRDNIRTRNFSQV